MVRATAELDLGSPITSSAGGVHIAAFGGLWLAVVFGVAGFRPKGDELVLNPSMPERWQALAFRIQWRGRIIHVRIDRVGNAVSTTLEKGDAVPLQVGDGVRYKLRHALSGAMNMAALRCPASSWQIGVVPKSLRGRSRRGSRIKMGRDTVNPVGSRRHYLDRGVHFLLYTRQSDIKGLPPLRVRLRRFF